MPPLETMDRKQKAVVWDKAGVDRDGQYTVGDGREINVRWGANDRQLVMLDPQGNTIMLDALVITDEVIDIGSIMWLGSLDDIPGTSLVPDSNLMQVKMYNVTPDIKNRNQRRELGLMKYNDILPVD